MAVPLRSLRAGRAVLLTSPRRVLGSRLFSNGIVLAYPARVEVTPEIASEAGSLNETIGKKRASRNKASESIQDENERVPDPGQEVSKPPRRKRAAKRKEAEDAQALDSGTSNALGAKTDCEDLHSGAPAITAGLGRTTQATRRRKKALSPAELPPSSQTTDGAGPPHAVKGRPKGETLSWDLGTGSGHAPTDPPGPVLTGTEALIHAETQRAMDEQRIPRSPLAESVYKNYLRFPGCIVLTRVGKFYESYYDAALHLTSIIDLKIAVKRNNVRWVEGRSKPRNGNSQLQFPFAGFPYTQIDKYLKLLVQDLGHTVVLVEEDRVSDKNEAGLVKRGVGRVVTPGTLLDESWLNAHESRYLLAISVSDKPGPITDDPVPSVPLWLAYTDVSTGEYFSKDTTLAKLEDELTRIGPREVVLDRSFAPYWSSLNEVGTRDDHSTMGELFSLLRALNPHVSFADTYLSPEIDGSPAKAVDQAILDANLEAQALSLLRHYVQYALRDHSPDLSVPQRQFDSAFMHIDAATLNGLEIKHSMRLGDGSRASPVSAKGTLLSVFDRTVTPAGHRLLVRTLSAPSTSIGTINHRLNLVQAFVEREDLREEVQETLKPLKDVVKLYQRVRQNRGDVDDIYEIAIWIEGISRICDRISSETQYERHNTPEDVAPATNDIGQRRLVDFVDSVHDLSELSRSIHLAINADIVKSSRRPMFAPSSASEDDDLEAPPEPEITALEDADVIDEEEGDSGGEDFPPGMPRANQELVKRFRRTELAFEQQWWIKPDASPRLRELHDKLDMIAERKEKLEGKIVNTFSVPAKDLCMIVCHERIGWKLLVSKASDRAQMTGEGGMRAFGGGQYGKFLEYDPITVLGNERERVAADLREEQLRVFKTLRASVVDAGEKLLHNASTADELDLAMGFAHIADDMGFVRPTLTDGTDFKVLDGRHPVVETALHSTARLFVPNSNSLTEDNHLHVITGPNQGGKSTFLRQTAVIAILAQSGSFVPADEAEIGIVDQLFSRIGARDDLFRDRSTFMLEMVETAAILRYATKRSLVIMDEYVAQQVGDVSDSRIGRGTTLQAGMAIAYATLDYILGNIGCRTLFATHYHELETMLKEREEDGTERVRRGVEYWCTDVDEADGAVSYSYRLKPGVNYDSHAILAARLAGMPPEFMRVAKEKLAMSASKSEH